MSTADKVPKHDAATEENADLEPAEDACANRCDDILPGESESEPGKATTPSLNDRPPGPTLDITDGKGRLKLDSRIVVLATMAHPDSELHRREVVAKVRIMLASGSRPESTIGAMTTVEIEAEERREALCQELARRLGWPSKDDLKALISAPSFEKLGARLRGCAFGSTSTGDILLYLMACSQHHPEQMTVKRAKYIASKDCFGAKTSGGRSLNYGMSTIAAGWSKFRPVAHLWAAHQMVKPEKRKAIFDLHETSSFIGFLAISESIRQFGISSSAKSEQRPFLDFKTTWRSPRDLLLPPVELKSDPLSEQALEWLRVYSD